MDSPTQAQHAGVRALWVKVIIRAVFDYATYKDSTKLQQRRWAITAHNWMFGVSVGFFNTFDNVCFHLEVDPELIRTWAKSITKNEVKKIEHLDRIQDPVKRYRSELEAFRSMSLAKKGIS